jgi:hypothetical protein
MLALSNPAMTAQLTGHPDRDHRAVPMQRMIITVMTPAGSGLRPMKITLPRVDALIAEMPEKYALPETPPKPQGAEHSVCKSAGGAGSS